MENVKSLIGDALESLRRVRAEVLGSVENSVIEQIDEVISKLEEADANNPGKYSAMDMLSALGKIVELIPAVAKLLELLLITRQA